MPYNTQIDILEPVNLSEHLDKIELYLGQVCQIAGISKMQLDYWTNKAQIPTKGKKQRIYDIDALETVMLIKQAKDKGLNLGAAIDAAVAEGAPAFHLLRGGEAYKYRWGATDRWNRRRSFQRVVQRRRA